MPALGCGAGTDPKIEGIDTVDDRSFFDLRPIVMIGVCNYSLARA